MPKCPPTIDSVAEPPVQKLLELVLMLVGASDPSLVIILLLDLILMDLPLLEKDKENDFIEASNLLFTTIGHLASLWCMS